MGRYLIILYFYLFCLHACNGYPVDIYNPEGSLGWTEPATFLSVAILMAAVLLVGGCMCCRHNKGFQEFTDSTSSHSLSAIPGGGYLSNAASTEFTMFPPLPPNSSAPGTVGAVDRTSVVHFEPLPQITPRSQAVPQTTRRPATFNNAVSTGLSAQGWFEDPHGNFPRNQMKYLREVGRGWFGRVIEGEAQGVVPGVSSSKVIVKVLLEDATPTDQMYFLHEVKSYRDLSHPNVLRLLGRCLETDPFLVLLESCSGGDLKTFLSQNISTAEALNQQGVTLLMACNIASGLQHMHSHGFVHTDLAARNCLVTSDLTIKIGDYGTSIDTFKEDYYCAGDVALPIRWCPPETLHCTETTIETKEVTPLANVWNLGVVLWEISEFGKLPYNDLSDDEVIIRVLGEGTHRLPMPVVESPFKSNLYLLMKLCWRLYEERPVLDQVVSMLNHIYSSHKMSCVSGETFILQSEEDFERRWEMFKPNSIPKMDNHKSRITNLENSSEITRSSIMNKSLILQRPCADSSRELTVIFSDLHNHTPQTTSPQPSLASSSGGEFFVPILDQKTRSASLQNLRGSIENLTETCVVGNSDSSLSCIKVDEASFHKQTAAKTKQFQDPVNSSDLSSWLQGVNTSDDEDAKFVQKISEAIRDLDDALAQERTSSSSSEVSSSVVSHHESPAKDQFIVSNENVVLDFRLGPSGGTCVSNNFDSLGEDKSISNEIKISGDSGTDTEDETWRKRIERGEFSEKVKEKSKSVTDLMVLTHIECSDGSDSEPPSLTWFVDRNSASRNSFSRQRRLSSNKNSFQLMGAGSDSNIHQTVLGEEFRTTLIKFQEAQRDGYREKFIHSVSSQGSDFNLTPSPTLDPLLQRLSPFSDESTSEIHSLLEPVQCVENNFLCNDASENILVETVNSEITSSASAVNGDSVIENKLGNVNIMEKSDFNVNYSHFYSDVCDLNDLSLENLKILTNTFIESEKYVTDYGKSATTGINSLSEIHHDPVQNIASPCHGQEDICNPNKNLEQGFKISSHPDISHVTEVVVPRCEGEKIFDKKCTEIFHDNLNKCVHSDTHQDKHITQEINGKELVISEANSSINFKNNSHTGQDALLETKLDNQQFTLSSIDLSDSIKELCHVNDVTVENSNNLTGPWTISASHNSQLHEKYDQSYIISSPDSPSLMAKVVNELSPCQKVNILENVPSIENNVILGPSEEFTLDYFRGLKTTSEDYNTFYFPSGSNDKCLLSSNEESNLNFDTSALQTVNDTTSEEALSDQQSFAVNLNEKDLFHERESVSDTCILSDSIKYSSQGLVKDSCHLENVNQACHQLKVDSGSGNVKQIILHTPSETEIKTESSATEPCAEHTAKSTILPDIMYNSPKIHLEEISACEASEHVYLDKESIIPSTNNDSTTLHNLLQKNSSKSFNKENNKESTDNLEVSMNVICANNLDLIEQKLLEICTLNIPKLNFIEATPATSGRSTPDADSVTQVSENIACHSNSEGSEIIYKKVNGSEMHENIPKFCGLDNIEIEINVDSIQNNLDDTTFKIDSEKAICPEGNEDVLTYGLKTDISANVKFNAENIDDQINKADNHFVNDIITLERQQGCVAAADSNIYFVKDAAFPDIKSVDSHMTYANVKNINDKILGLKFETLESSKNDQQASCLNDDLHLININENFLKENCTYRDHERSCSHSIANETFDLDDSLADNISNSQKDLNSLHSKFGTEVVAEGDDEIDDFALDVAKHSTPDDERSSDSGFRDKGSLSESCEDACDEKYNLEDIEAELEETFNKGNINDTVKVNDCGDDLEQYYGSPDLPEDCVISHSYSVKSANSQDVGIIPTEEVNSDNSNYLALNSKVNCISHDMPLHMPEDIPSQNTDVKLADSFLGVNSTVGSSDCFVGLPVQSQSITRSLPIEDNLSPEFHLLQEIRTFDESMSDGMHDMGGLYSVYENELVPLHYGWFLHEPNDKKILNYEYQGDELQRNLSISENLSPVSSVSEGSKGNDSNTSDNYTPLSLDEEFVTAIRNELREKLPCVSQQSQSSEMEELDEDICREDRADITIHYNVYPAPLSPILEERESVSSVTTTISDIPVQVFGTNFMKDESDSEPSSPVFLLDPVSGDKNTSELNTKKFEEEIRQALENCSSVSSIDSDCSEKEQLKSNVIFEDLDEISTTFHKNKPMVIKGTSQHIEEIDDDLLVVDTETNKVTILESPKPKSCLAFVSSRKDANDTGSYSDCSPEIDSLENDNENCHADDRMVDEESDHNFENDREVASDEEVFTPDSIERCGSDSMTADHSSDIDNVSKFIMCFENSSVPNSSPQISLDCTKIFDFNSLPNSSASEEIDNSNSLPTENFYMSVSESSDLQNVFAFLNVKNEERGEPELIDDNECDPALTNGRSITIGVSVDDSLLDHYATRPDVRENDIHSQNVFSPELYVNVQEENLKDHDDTCVSEKSNDLMLENKNVTINNVISAGSIEIQQAKLETDEFSKSNVCVTENLHTCTHFTEDINKCTDKNNKPEPFEGNIQKPENEFENERKECVNVIDDCDWSVTNTEAGVLSTKAPMPSPEEESWKQLPSMLAFSDLISDSRLRSDDIMSTSFSLKDEDTEDLADCYTPDWESCSEDTNEEDNSSSSGEFIWKEGDKEASVKTVTLPSSNSTSKMYEPMSDFPMEVIEEEEENDEDDEDCSSSSGSGTEFIPSAWNSEAVPNRSALRSPEKKSEQKKNVTFKKQKYHCVYEYPKEASDSDSEEIDSPLRKRWDVYQTDVDYANYADWDLILEGDPPGVSSEAESEPVVPKNPVPDLVDFYKLSNVDYDFGNGPALEEGEFFISSSSRPFQFSSNGTDIFSGSESQFFPGMDCVESVDPENIDLEFGKMSMLGVVDSIGDGVDSSDLQGAIFTPLASSLTFDPKNSSPYQALRPENVSLQNDGSKSDDSPSDLSPPSPLSPLGLGELRHTRDKLKLDLPMTGSPFTLETPTFPPTGIKRRQVEPVKGEASVLDSGEETEDSGIESTNGNRGECLESAVQL